MRTFFSLLLLGLSLSACQFIAPDADGDRTTPRLGEPFELAFGETTQVSGTNLSLSFVDVGDSRCPKNVTCIWQGEGSVALDVVLAEDAIAPPGPDSLLIGDTLRVGPYGIQLLELNPYPEADVSTPKSSYRALLKVE